MKDQMLKIAGVKSEKEFYKKFPTEEAFMAKHGKKLEKAAMGKSMINKQLKQLTDFGNPPIAQVGAKLDTSIIPSYKTPGAPTMAGLNTKLSNPAFQQQAIKNVEASAPAPSGGGLGEAAGAAGMGLLQNAGKIIGGFQAMGNQKKKIKDANMMSSISGLGLEAAAGARRNKPKNQYVRPEDNLVQPDQLGSSQGTGSDILSMKRGGEIQNTYAPYTLYDDLGQVPKAEFGEYFQDSGQAQVGGAAGEALGSAFFGPAGGAVGKIVGQVAGNLLGGAKDARNLKKAQDATLLNQQQTAMQSTMENQFGASMKEGGWVSHDWQPQVITKFGEHPMSHLLKPDPTMNTLRSGGHLAQVNYTPPSAEAMFTGKRDLPYQMEDGGYMAMGGNLQTHWGGDAEHMSYNPYIPGGGETVMFRGQSHDDTNGKGQSGIGVTYGDNPVEVERGEPMTEMNGGGIVFGNMMMPGGKQKFKKYAADLSKTEAKQNKVMDKASKLAIDADENDPFGRLSLNSSQASLIGANMKLKNIAQKKQDAADLQSAILDTADEMGLVADDLAKGKIKKAKFGGKMTAQDGKAIYTYNGMTLDPNKPEHAAIIKREQASMDAQHADIQAHFANKNKTDDSYTPMARLDQSIVGGRPSLMSPNAPQSIRQNSLPEAIAPYQDKPFAGSSSYGEGYTTPTVKESLNTMFPSRERSNMPSYNVDMSTIPGASTPSHTTGMANVPEGFAERAMANAEGITPIGADGPGFFNKAFQTLGKGAKGAGKFIGKGFDKYGEAALSNIAPFLRPTDQEGLDPMQLMGEQYALANNQLEAVQAQKFQPQLGGVMDMSYQDQLNEITAQSRAAERMMQNNPEAAANLFAQAAQAKSKVVAEGNRANMAGRKQVYDENRNLLNQAQLQNLQILDKQYERQSMAKSNTKAQAQAALSSIGDKMAKNKLENRQLGVMENMYNYRFGPNGQAINMNAPAQFNLSGKGGGNTGKQTPPSGFKFTYNDDGSVADMKPIKGKNGITVKSFNGSIVKGLKNI